MPARLYARFSPRPNAQDCDSNDRQLADLERWCRDRGIPVAGRYRDDAVSGAERDRTGFWSCIADCKPGDIILVRDWDRFARDRGFAGYVLSDLRRRGIQVRSITQTGDMPESSETRLISNIMLDFAEYQREITASRTKAAMLRKQKEGEKVSNIPLFGYRHEGDRLVEVPEEQVALSRAKQLLADGNSYKRTAKVLNDEGVTYRGRRWHHWKVSKIARRGW